MVTVEAMDGKRKLDDGRETEKSPSSVNAVEPPIKKARLEGDTTQQLQAAVDAEVPTPINNTEAQPLGTHIPGPSTKDEVREEGGCPSPAPALEKVASSTGEKVEGAKPEKVAAGEGANEGGEKATKYKKRKVAMFFAYVGVGYQGMQRNPGARTIESELETALFRAGAISEQNFGDPKKVNWMRAARTDKGVSAVGQVVSAKIVVDPPGFVARLNSHLPPEIVCLGYKRVTNSFDAKNLCDRRRYEYVLPTFAFDPSAYRPSSCYANGSAPAGTAPAPSTVPAPAPSTDAVQATPAGKASEAAAVAGAPAGTATAETESVPPAGRTAEPSADNKVAKEEAPIPTTGATSEVEDSASVPAAEPSKASEGGAVEGGLAPPAAAGAEPVPFVFNDEVRKRLNRLLAMYCGTHNFHNFTSKTAALDPSANRYILSFKASKPFTVEGLELVRLQVVGQSFMLHQIRKMVGLIVAVMRGLHSEAFMEKALNKYENVIVPTAPEVGLYLDECIYVAYNRRFGDTHEELNLGEWKEEVEKFKKERLHKHIVNMEREERTVAVWLRSLNPLNYKSAPPSA